MTPFSPSTRGRGLALTPPAGLVARGSWLFLGLPGAKLQWQVEGSSPLTVAGAAAALGITLTAFPFFVPHHAGTDDARDYSCPALPRKPPPLNAFDKGGASRLNCSHSTVSRGESEQGTR